jgi:Fanconi anemia group M protein
MTHVTHPLVRENSVKLRRYQEAIVGVACENNTLVVLPTGLGKTIVAFLVMAHRLTLFPDSKLLFLAPTKPLVVQHKRSFDDLIPGRKTALLTGEENASKRKNTWGESQIIFATPQTIENDIIRNLNLENVSLIVFDEAHRAVGDYSYAYIAKKYAETGRDQLILGLTASPGSDKEKIDEVCENLHIQRIEAKTESDKDVKPYVQPVETRWVKVRLPEKFLEIKKMLEEVLKEDLKELKAAGVIETSDLSKINKRMILEAQSRIREDFDKGVAAYTQASLAASALKVNHAIELLETQGIDATDTYFKRLVTQNTKAVKRLLRNVNMKNAMTNIRLLKEQGVDHPKLDKLVEIVSKRKKDKTLIFTHYRDSVDKIIEKLNEADILAHAFIGQTKKEGKGMSQKEQVKAIENFKEGKFNALIATSVAEEGLDIPKVDLVVFYEPIPSEIRVIQRRGRTGRSDTGEVIILMAEGTRDEAYFWTSFRKERTMKRNIKGLKKTHIKTEGEESKPYGQQSLLTYSPREDKAKVKIYVDHRESPYIKKLLKELCEIELAQLDVGDYILSDRVCAERKTIEDFLQSIIDKRLLSQASELKRNFQTPVLILEGFRDLYVQRNIHPNAIRGALAALAIDFNIPIIPSQNEEETAAILFAMAKREQEDEKRLVSLRGEKKPMTLGERQQYVIESLPNISSVLAKRLLEKFDTVQSIINASEKELTDIEGIGEKKAEEIRKVVKASFKNNLKEDG